MLNEMKTKRKKIEMEILRRKGAGQENLGFAGAVVVGRGGATLYSNVRNMFFSSHP